MPWWRKIANAGQQEFVDPIPSASRTPFVAVSVAGSESEGFLRVYRGFHDERLVVLCAGHLRSENPKPVIFSRPGFSQPTHSFLIESCDLDFSNQRTHLKAQIDVTNGLLERIRRKIEKDKIRALATQKLENYRLRILASADECARQATDMVARRILVQGLIEVCPSSAETDAWNAVIRSSDNSYVTEARKALAVAVASNAAACEIEALERDLAGKEQAFRDRLNAARLELRAATEKSEKDSRELARQISKRGFLGESLDLFGKSNQEAFFWATTISAWIRLWEYPEY